MREHDLLLEAEAAARRPLETTRLRPLLELTTNVDATDEDRLQALLETAEAEGLAALRIPAAALDGLKRRRTSLGLRLTTTANAEGGDDIDAVATEVRLAAEAGADEIDLGIPFAAVQDGDLALVGELIQTARASAGNAKLGAILGARQLASPIALTAAARAAVMGGVEALVTDSSGEPSDLSAVATVLAVLEEAEGQVGLKVPAGNDLEATWASVLHLVEHFLGRDWPTPATFRLLVES